GVENAIPVEIGKSQRVGVQANAIGYGTAKCSVSVAQHHGEGALRPQRDRQIGMVVTIEIGDRKIDRSDSNQEVDSGIEIAIAMAYQDRDRIRLSIRNDQVQ